MHDAKAAKGAVEGRDMDAVAQRPAEIGRMPEGDIARRDRRPAGAKEPVGRGREDGEKQPQRRADADGPRSVDRVDGNVEAAAGVQGGDRGLFFRQDLPHVRPRQGRDHVVMRTLIQRLLPVAAFIGADDGGRVAVKAPGGKAVGQRRGRPRDGQHDGGGTVAGQRRVQRAARRGAVIGQCQHGPCLQRALYLASTSSIALTFPAERPLASKLSFRKASAMDFATSAPITRAPMVMIWALFDSAARSAE